MKFLYKLEYLKLDFSYINIENLKYLKNSLIQLSNLIDLELILYDNNLGLIKDNSYYLCYIFDKLKNLESLNLDLDSNNL